MMQRIDLRGPSYMSQTRHLYVAQVVPLGCARANDARQRRPSAVMKKA